MYYTTYYTSHTELALYWEVMASSVGERLFGEVCVKVASQRELVIS